MASNLQQQHRAIVHQNASAAQAEDTSTVDFEQQPKFTAEDDRRDLQSLTIDDLVRLQADLTGMTAAGVPGEALGSPIQQDTAQLLASLDEELAKLPSESTSSYYQAVKKCPREVSAKRRLTFLECEANDAVLAAKRLAGYWELRLEFFGPEKCYLPMVLAGAVSEEMVNIATRRVYQLLPCTDAAGRGIIYMRISNRDFAHYTLEEEFKAFYYLMEILTLNESIRRRGFVVLVDDQSSSRKNYAIKFQRYSRIMDHTFPIRLRAFHLCHPSKTMFYIIWPACKHFLPKHVRIRGALHHGSTADVLRSLCTYNLFPDCLPTELGGNVVLDTKHFLYERMATEAAMFGLPFPAITMDKQRFGSGPTWAGINHVGADSFVYASGHPSSTSQSSTAVAAAAAATATGPAQQSHYSDQNVSSANLIAASSTAAASDLSSSSAACKASEATKRNSSSSSGEKIRRRRRRRSSSTKKESMVDPRMAKAVKAKQADPKMKLCDALVLGGYVFYEKTGCEDLVNQDGTSLRQCKNNLCRRLRIERERKKAGQVSSSDQADSESTLSSGGEKEDQKGGEGEPGQGGEGGEEKEEERKPPAKPSGGLSSKAYQYDSFDEEIFQLPGWSDDDTNDK